MILETKACSQERVTCRMVAERAGVSQPTVSRVLNGSGLVAPETIQRVRKAIRELGYGIEISGLADCDLPFSSLVGEEMELPKQPRTTLTMVANRAGVSIATVSRVLNNRLVHAETAIKVRTAMRELGFAPSFPIPRRRTLTQRGNIAFFSPVDKQESMANTPLLNNVLRGIVLALSEQGLSLLQNTFNNFPTVLAMHRVDGVIIWPHLQGVSPEIIEMLRSYPVVYMMSMPEERLVGDRAKPNQRRIGELAAQYLLSRGHKSTAVITTTNMESWLSERSDTFLKTVKHSGVIESQATLAIVPWNKSCEVIPVHDCSEFDVALEDTLRPLLERSPRPTGLLVNCDALTGHVYRHLKQRGIQIGKEIEIISCNNESPILSCLDPSPKSIDVNPEEIGRKTVERLLWRIHNPKFDSHFCVEVQPRIL